MYTLRNGPAAKGNHQGITPAITPLHAVLTTLTTTQDVHKTYYGFGKPF